MKINNTINSSIVILSLLTLVLSSCMKDDPMNLVFESMQPREINDGLDLSSPQNEGIDADRLNQIYEDVYSDQNLWSMRSLLVFKNGKLVSEAYLKNQEDITNRHLIWSSTKQVLGIMTGIALDKGIISSLDDPISDYLFTELKEHPEKAGITIRQLLTMHSGIDYNNDGIGGQTDKLLRQIPDSIVPFILSRPMRNNPGTDFYYNDGDPHLVAALIQNAIGKPMDEWAHEVFFSQIGANNLNWVRYKDRTTLGGYGIETTPRELGKIALCVANQGKFNGKQVIPSGYLVDMLAEHVKVSEDYSFGYYWWKDPSRNVHFTWGHGGQFALIVPAESLVVVITSIPNTQGDYQITADEVLPIVDKIIDACN